MTSPCHNPDDSEASKDDLRHLVLLDIFTKFGELQPGICAVVEDEDEGPNPDEVAGPGEGQQQDGDDVVHQVLQEVLPLHIRKLCDGQGYVETNFYE